MSSTAFRSYPQLAHYSKFSRPGSVSRELGTFISIPFYLRNQDKMKQKVVIKVTMNDQKSRKKAMKTVVGHSGVESTALKGNEKNEIEVVGDGIDAVALTTLLRKNVGYAELLTVGPVGDKKDGDKKDDGKKDDAKKNEPTSVIWSSHPYVYSGPPYQIYEARDPSYEPGCTII